MKVDDIGHIFTDVTDWSKWRLVGIAYDPSAIFYNVETKERRVCVIGSLLAEKMVKETEYEMVVMYNPRKNKIYLRYKYCFEAARNGYLQSPIENDEAEKLGSFVVGDL